MAGYCNVLLYFHSSVARENMAANSCNMQPYCLLTHQVMCMYMQLHIPLCKKMVMKLLIARKIVFKVYSKPGWIKNSAVLSGHHHGNWFFHLYSSSWRVMRGH